MKIKICDACGKPFETSSSKKIYCSRVCASKMNLIKTKERSEKNKFEKSKYMHERSKEKKRKEEAACIAERRKSLERKIKEAQAAGMSYGQYQALERAKSVKVDIRR